VHGFHPALQDLKAIRFDHGVDDERRAGFALAPATVAAVHEHRFAGHAVTHGTAGAGAFELEFLVIGHGCYSGFGGA
jgi:hypothetical protein